MTLTFQQLKISETIDGAREKLITISHQIHDHPELGNEEVFAAQTLVDYLTEAGFTVEKGFAGIPTAFCARKGTGKRKVAFLAEYDALPEIGHACGHNIIASTALAAGLGLGSVVNEIDGEVWVIGTPAEETNGAKVPMADNGIFDGFDAVMMAHPYSGNYRGVESLAMDALQVSYYGKTAHAAAAPWDGINALDAVLLLFSNINALRQQMRTDGRIHGIITKGGTAPNVIPEYTEARFYVRAKRRDYLKELVGRFKQCAEGAALATGTRCEITNYEYSFDEMVNNDSLAERTTDYMEKEMGTTPFKKLPDSFGSLDMGNVSRRAPGVHILVDIADGRYIAGHTAAFCVAARSASGDKAIINAGKSLALTAFDVITNSDFRAKVRAEFERYQQGLV